MSWVNGPTGPQGFQGPQGLQGRQGFVGPAFGPTGPVFATKPVIDVITPLTDSVTLPPSTTVYNLIIGSATITVPSISIVYPNPEQSGTYWVFKNNSTIALTLIFNGGYTGSYTLPVGQCVSLIVFIDANYNATYSLV
jgi:hypothetical protein